MSVGCTLQAHLQFSVAVTQTLPSGEIWIERTCDAARLWIWRCSRNERNASGQQESEAVYAAKEGEATPVERELALGEVAVAGRETEVDVVAVVAGTTKKERSLASPSSRRGSTSNFARATILQLCTRHIVPWPIMSPRQLVQRRAMQYQARTPVSFWHLRLLLANILSPAHPAGGSRTTSLA